MKAVVLQVEGIERDRVIAELWEAGTLGITEEPLWIKAFFEDSTAAEAAAAQLRAFEPELVEDEDRDWREAVEAAWPPVAVGERFYLVPEFRDDPAPPGRRRLTTYPGMACGSGAHPCTQLCLVAMERYLPRPGYLLDVGTGSGILTSAAILLGCKHVAACDTDVDATGVAAQNLARDGVHAELFAGSVRALRPGFVNTVLANLNAHTIRGLEVELRRVLREGALCVFSGFEESEAAGVAALCSKIEETLEQDGWACVIGFL